MVNDLFKILNPNSRTVNLMQNTCISDLSSRALDDSRNCQMIQWNKRSMHHVEKNPSNRENESVNWYLQRKNCSLQKKPHKINNMINCSVVHAHEHWFYLRWRTQKKVLNDTKNSNKQMKYQNLCMCDSYELWAASFIDDDEIFC